jgi:GAF domain-containing protein
VTEGTLLDVLRGLAHELVERLDADASVISRVLGDALIVITSTSTDEHHLSLGQGFLVSDFPPTKRVLDSGAPAVLTLEDPDVDPAEAELLRELGYATLLMTPLEVRGVRWGLVEVYRTDVRPFSSAQVAAAASLARI